MPGSGSRLLVAFTAYVLALTQMQHTTERTYAELRKSDPDLYLAKIRQAEGFPQSICANSPSSRATRRRRPKRRRS